MTGPRAEPPLGSLGRPETRSRRKPGCFRSQPPRLRLLGLLPSARYPPPWLVLNNRPYARWSPGRPVGNHAQRSVPALQRAADKKKRLFFGVEKRTLSSQDKPRLSGPSLAP